MDDLKRNLSINTKIIVIILLNIIILSGLLYGVSTSIILKNYIKIENDETRVNLERVNSSIQNEIAQLTVKAKDWAYWDDTYKFVQDKNQAYIDSNLAAISIVSLKINLVAYFDSRGELFFEKVVDLKSGEEVNSEKTKDVLSSSNELASHKNIDDSVGGIIMTPDGPLLVASSPILTSEVEGPIQGSLVFGRYLDDEMVNELGNSTHLSLKLYDLNSTSLPPDVLNAKGEILKNGNKYFTSPISKNEIAGYMTLNDLYNNPTLVLRIDTPRTIYKQGQNTLQKFVSIIGLLVLLSGVFHVFMIRKYIVGRISVLSREVKQIYETGNLEIKLKEGGRDEIGVLARVINKIFYSLAFSKKIEKEAKIKLEETLNEQKKHIDETEKLNKLMIGRELEMIKLKKETEELKVKQS